MSQIELTQQQRKEAFNQYLESNGFIEQLNKIFLQLYNEQEFPQNPLDVLLKQLQGPNEVDVDQLQLNVDNIKEENQSLHTQIDDMKQQVTDLKTSLGYY